MKKILAVIIALVGAQAFADPMTVRIGMEANAPVTELQAFVDKANTLAEEINPDSKTIATLYQDTFHGSGGGLSLVLSYENPAAWAAEGESNQSSAEWGQLMQQFPADSFPVNFQGMSNVVYQSSNYQPPQAGEVLVIFGFTNNVGGVGPLVEFVQKVGTLSKQLGIDSVTEVLVPIAAGTATRGVTIVARFRNATAWAAAGEKQQASAEWGQLFATFPTQSYSLDYQGMSFVVQ